jgi:L-2-hydroxyglutarate oxidase LhgO
VGITWLVQNQIAQYEPKCQGLAALHCATTGIVNFREVALTYARDFQEMEGVLLTGFEVVDIRQEGYSSDHQIIALDQVSGGGGESV